jgi:hypothetical protein
MKKGGAMKKRIFIFGILLSVTFFLAGVTFSRGEEGDVAYDILIKNGKVFDGSLNKAFDADIAIKGDTIIRVAKSIKGKATRVIEAKGLHITPGFIDLHTHVDGGMYFPENRACLNYLKQGYKKRLKETAV